jgi:hypothetical protein
MPIKNGKTQRHVHMTRNDNNNDDDELNSNSASQNSPFSILGPGVYSASTINQYQKQKSNVSGE